MDAPTSGKIKPGGVGNVLNGHNLTYLSMLAPWASGKHPNRTGSPMKGIDQGIEGTVLFRTAFGSAEHLPGGFIHDRR